MIRSLGTLLLAAMPLSTAVPPSGAAAPVTPGITGREVVVTDSGANGLHTFKAAKRAGAMCIAGLDEDTPAEHRAWLDEARDVLPMDDAALGVRPPRTFIPFGVMRLVEGGDQPHLERAVLHFAPATQKIEVMRQVTIPLAKHPTSDPTVSVYAYRAKDAVHLVVPALGNSHAVFSDVGSSGRENQRTFNPCGLVDLRLPTATRGAFVQLSGETPGAKPHNFTLNASVTKTARDPEPLVSIALSRMTD
jgi:hypothetical protein